MSYGQTTVNDRQVASSAAAVLLQKVLVKAGTVYVVDRIRVALLSLDL